MPPPRSKSGNYLSGRIRSIVCSEVRHLSLDKPHIQRGGVIVYTRYIGQLYFALGVDSGTGELTDFGGGISYRRDANAVTGSLREFHEETLGVFGIHTEAQVQSCLCIHDGCTLIIFLYLDVRPFSEAEAFSRACAAATRPEVTSVSWMQLSQLKRLIKRNRSCLYARIRSLLRAAGNFYPLLQCY